MRRKGPATCAVDGCNKPVHGHSYCSTHEVRFLNHGDPLYVYERPTPGRNRKVCVDAIRAATVCAKCGAQPVDFHREEHVAHPENRVGQLLISAASLQRIIQEIALCEPLCRRCHMTEDGRLAGMADHRLKKQPPKPCSECGRLYKPLRRGLCTACAQRATRRLISAAD